MKPLPPELEAHIDEIKSWMFDGDQRQVAKLSNTDEGRVSKILSKKIFPCKKVLIAGTKVMNDNKAMFAISPLMKVG